MPYVKHRIAAMIVAMPEQAVEVIVKAYTEAGANKRGAAELLNCNEKTFQIWAEKLGLEKRLEEIQLQSYKEGWHHDRNRMGGRKPGGTNRKKSRKGKAKR